MSREISQQEWAELRRDAEPMDGLDIEGADISKVLLKYQQDLLAATALHRVVVVEKSRRTGYTWAIGADAVLTAGSAKADGGMDVLYIGYNLDMAREFIDTCAMWAKAFNQAAGQVEEFLFTEKDQYGEQSIQAFRIRFDSGYEIVALTSRPRSLRGRQGFVILDEAAFHDDLEEMLKAAMALLIWGGKVLVISTHDGDTNPFAVLVDDIKKGRKKYHLITLDFDQALMDGLYQRICLVNGWKWSPEIEAAWRSEIVGHYGSAADEELYVIPSSGSGSFIPAILIERSQRQGVPVLRWSVGKDFLELSEPARKAEAMRFCIEEIMPALKRVDPLFPNCFGEDFAMSGDLTVFWIMQTLQNMRRSTPFTVELRRVPYPQQKQILWFILDNLPRLTGGCMDATGNGAPLAQETALKYGLERIVQVIINPAWYKNVGQHFQGAFEDGIIEIPADLDVYNDLRSIKLVNGIAHVERQSKRQGKGEDAGKEKDQQRHGDAGIACLMAYTASRLNLVGPIDPKTIPGVRIGARLADYTGVQGRRDTAGYI